MSQKSSINVLMQEDNFESQCDKEDPHNMNPMICNTVGVVFEDETKNACHNNPTTSTTDEVQYCSAFHIEAASDFHDPERLHKLLTPFQKDFNTSLPRQQFNRRPVVLQQTTIHDGQQQQHKESQFRCMEKGENPETAMHVEFTFTYDDNQNIADGPAHPQKNIVIDYKTLRKSGHFLKYGTNRKNLYMTDPVNLGISKVDYVQSWLACMPNDSAFLKDSDYDIMGEKELQNINLSFNLPKFTSQEEEFKYMFLLSNTVKFSFKPVSTMTHKQLELILEAANIQIFAYLEKNHKDPRFLEHEYVNGKFEIPPSWKNQEQQLFQSNGIQRTSLLEVIKSWICSIGSFIRGQGVNSKININDIDVPDSEEGKIMLKPYHGPVKVNGALIESGSTKPMVYNGVLGNIIEEVKAALQAINDSLRKVSPKTSLPNTMQKPLLCQQREDAEIKRLTEVLQKQKTQKKFKSRTVFGLKSADKIPTYAIHFRRRRQIVMRTRQNSFFRTVSGWIQRKAHHGSVRPLIRHSNSNQAHMSQQHGRSSVESNCASAGTYFGTTFTGIMNALRSFGSPLQLSPAIPASNNDGQVENFRPHRSNLRVETSLNMPPSHSRVSRNNERRSRNYNSKRMFAVRML